ncbi:MAG TPA: citrate synthase [Actinomycetes bacterium]|nr:citrate synthase [Actinomycetes bacterium]
MINERRRLTVGEAAERLGVKPATLYAYVSRGLLGRERARDGRSSTFDPAEVERLALRGRRRGRPGASGLVIQSAVTAIEGGRLFYRGVDVATLAGARRFEEVAEWLWTGAFPPPGAEPWRASPAAVAAGSGAQAALPAGTLPLERLRVIAAALATADDLRLELHPAAVVATGRSLEAGLVDCLPRLGPPGGSGIAARLWTGLCPHEPSPGLLAALDAALVLLADHELAASTLAARVAASVRADPYAVAAAGLGTVGGTLHGGATLAMEGLLAEVGAPELAARAVGERLRRGERLRGIGHPLYPGGDPRAGVLLSLLRRAAASPALAAPNLAARLAVVEAVLEATRRRGLPPPNVDFALAALAHVAGMTRGAAEAVFAVARAAGWLAHALEEYEGGRPFRPRAVYVGPPPG